MSWLYILLWYFVPFCKGSVYFATKMLTATAWLELLCCQSEAWQKRNKNKKETLKLSPNHNSKP